MKWLFLHLPVDQMFVFLVNDQTGVVCTASLLRFFLLSFTSSCWMASFQGMSLWWIIRELCSIQNWYWGFEAFVLSLQNTEELMKESSFQNVCDYRWSCLSEMVLVMQILEVAELNVSARPVGKLQSKEVLYIYNSRNNSNVFHDRFCILLLPMNLLIWGKSWFLFSYSKTDETKLLSGKFTR